MRVKMENSVRKIPVVVSEDDLDGGALEILRVIRPTWPQKDINFKLLTDGLTNKLIGCNLTGGREEDTVLVRVYGNKTDMFIDRQAETKNILMLNKVGLAPTLYATFQNGLAYEFVPGCTLNDKTVLEPRIYRLVASHMARLHRTKVPSVTDPQPTLWNKLRDFLNLVPDRFTDEEKQRRFEQVLIPKSEIKREIETLREKLTKLDSPVVFAHNDLLLGNVIYTESENKVTFIDFEFATFNYQAFDIGNHFAEFAGTDSVDYSKYPNKALQYDWLRTYLEALMGENDIKEKLVERLYLQVNQFALASHILWGVWALIQAEHSYIDFDYMGYAATRFDEYFKKKEKFLSLDLPD